MRIKYEKETDKEAMVFNPRGMNASIGYIAWLEAKAEAYDRLMSGGRKSPQEVANFLGMYVVKNIDGSWWGFDKQPVINTRYMIWTNPMGGCFMEIPSFLWRSIDYIGKWEDSLTLPDGWEEVK